MNLSRFAESVIFVFGSNRQGIHDADAVRFARQHRGAQTGIGDGLDGQSYALATKHTPHDPRPDPALLQEILARFLAFA
ncbi:A1S_2505 family phage non-structural protein [Acidithiobacillus caldus]